MSVSPLKLLRVEAGWTQKGLAKAADVDPSYVSQLETKDEINVTIRTARKLAGALSKRLGREVSPSDLFPEEDHSDSASSHATNTA